MASLTQKIAHNTLYHVGGRFISSVLGVFAIGITARYLGQEGFGGFTTILAFLQFFGIIIDFGLILVTVQMLSEPGVDTNRILNNIFTLRFFSAFILLGLAPLVVLFFPYPSIVKAGVALTTISFFFIALNQVLIGYFQKTLRTIKVAVSEIAGRIFLLFFVVAAVYIDGGLLAVMFAVVIGSAINFFINCLFVLKYIRLRFRFDFSIWQRIIGKSWPIAIGIIFNLVYLKGDTIVLSLFKSQSEVGIYGAPYRVLEIFISFPMMFIALVLPTLTSSWIKREISRFYFAMQRSFDFLSIVAIPMVFGTWFLARRIMVAVAGPEFAVSGSVLRIIMIATAIIFLGSLFGHTIVAINRQKSIIWAYILTAILGLLTYIIVIPRYSYMGAAWSTVFVEAFINTILCIATWKMTKFFPSFRVFFKTIMASIIMMIFLYFYQRASLYFSIPFAMLIYFVALYILRGFTKEDVLKVVGVKREM